MSPKPSPLSRLREPARHRGLSPVSRRTLHGLRASSAFRETGDCRQWRNASTAPLPPPRPQRLALLLPLIVLLAAAACDSDSSFFGGFKAATPTPTPVALTHDITGKILLEGRDRHSGALVFLGGTSYSCLTDTQGAYTISHVPPGRYELLAEKDGFEDALIAELNLSASGQPQVFRESPATLQALAVPASSPAAKGAEEPTSLAGRVELKGAQNQSGVLARILETGDAVETDSKGEFYFANLEPGAFRVEFIKAGYGRVESPVNIKRGAANRMEPVALEPRSDAKSNRIIAGQVFMFDANGVAQADFDRVTISVEGLDRSATLGPDGSFRFEGLPPAKLTVSGSADGYRLEAPAEVDLEMTDMANVELRFISETPASKETAGAVMGRVVRQGDEGSQSGIAVALAGSQFASLTAPNGGFLFEGVPAGAYVLYARAEGYDPLEMPGVEITAGETLDLGELTLQRSVEPPRVVRTQPQDGDQNVPVVERLPVLVQFSKPMQPDSVKAAFKIRPSVECQLYAGREHPQSDDRRLYVELLGNATDNYVDFDTVYKITIAKSAVDLDGIAMAQDYSFQFRTAGPMVVGTNPPDGAKNVSLDPTRGIVFFLNDQLRARSLDARLIAVRPPLESNPRIDSVSDPVSGWSRIQVYGPWKQDTLYSVTLSAGILTMDGNKFANTPYTVTFRTAPWVPIIPYDSGRERIRPTQRR